MSGRFHFCEDIGLFVRGRISPEDARRQETTAREILKRLESLPGVILADEVGMGKTFVSLAVAVSVALADKRRRPVVVMVPGTLREKWPQDFSLFLEKCIPDHLRDRLRSGSARRAVAFLKMLDDPFERRNSIIFLTHGAMRMGLRDKWVKLAVIWRSLYRKHDIAPLRRALGRAIPSLLHLRGIAGEGDPFWEELLTTAPEEWLQVLHDHNIIPEGDDDPVPEAVTRVLRKLDASEVFEALQEIPWRRTKHYDSKIKRARGSLESAIKDLWEECLGQLKIHSPLLILDEAHHLKNARTRLSSLFQAPEAEGDADEISGGPLGGVFERMLFLTATPFQLGHHELCSVLERFNGIAWRGSHVPNLGRDRFQKKIEDLGANLDRAQESALNLEAAWGMLREEDLQIEEEDCSKDVEQWWDKLQEGAAASIAAERVLSSFHAARDSLKKAEKALAPWVIRHLKPSFLPEPYNEILRRQRYSGRAILDRSKGENIPGLELAGNDLLPFLLAARAAVCAPTQRPVFAEGLASCYEAFLHTRNHIKDELSATDEDDVAIDVAAPGERARWYLDQLNQAIPPSDHRSSGSHPKVAATVKRAIEAWGEGEKVVVFCHFVETGRTLRRVISGFMRDEIVRRGATLLGCPEDEVEEQLERLGDRFFDVDSPARKAADDEVRKMLREYDDLEQHQDLLAELARRYLRTPSFLVRYFPLTSESRIDAEMIEAVFEREDASGLSFRQLLDRFFLFLVERCGAEERLRYIDAINSIQTGAIRARGDEESLSDDEIQGEGSRILPNVRLVNGATAQETRQRLMLSFNTPFFPEILIASSVMAEGVDLHRYCRHVIHHDLCWNPSTLEQRSGRIDRIGAKVESCGHPIEVYLPYIAATQDEKMYRVVMDREKWFSIVMGGEFATDEQTTEKMAQRIPLPDALVRELAFNLSLK